MKRKFSKILGVGLTLALLTSLLLTAAPVSAVTTPVVTLTADPTTDAYVISKVNTYTVLFTTGVVVPSGGDIVVGFDAGTNITGMAAADIQIDSTDGIGGTAISGGTPSAVAVAGVYPAAQTLTITLPAAIGAGAIVQLIIDNVTNPNTAGAYNLTVATQDAADPAVVIEAAVPSLDYTIKVPTIPGLPGVASVYNPTGVLMAQENNLVTAMEKAGSDYTIYVGPGTYTFLSTETLHIPHEGLTFVSTGGAAVTIIDGSACTQGHVINIFDDDVTVEGFTVKGNGAAANVDGIWIMASSAGATVENNVFTDTKIGVVLTWDINGPTNIVDGATVSGNVIEDSYAGIATEGCTKDCTISDNTITDCTGRGIGFTAGTSANPTKGNTISENTITGSGDRGIYVKKAGDGREYFDNNVIDGNTVSGGEFRGIEIQDGLTVTKLVITGNDITANEGGGIIVGTPTAGTCAIKFNTIIGNDINTGDYGIHNICGTAVDVDATLNWWGTTVAADIAAMVTATTTGGTVTTAPFLAGTADTVFSASAAGTGASLDASTTVGVKVEGAADDATIAVAEYIADPQAAIAGAIAFYDVYVAEPTASTTVTVKFYAGDALTDVYLWAAGTQIWAKVDDAKVSFSAYGGFISVTVDPAMLAGTPFALVAGTADPILAPEIFSPVVGDDTVPLRPVFAWKAVTGADGYYFELADNAEFVVPLVKMEGDMGRLSGTTYAYVGEELPYSTPYHWRVKAVSGTIGVGDLAESDWTGGVFITMNEPVEPTPPVVIEPTPPAPAPIIEPIVEVITPPATEVTPGWIYAIIGVGAVLVIALLVLIVRTRRVA